MSSVLQNYSSDRTIRHGWYKVNNKKLIYIFIDLVIGIYPASIMYKDKENEKGVHTIIIQFKNDIQYLSPREYPHLYI